MKMNIHRQGELYNEIVKRACVFPATIITTMTIILEEIRGFFGKAKVAFVLFLI